MYKSHLPPLLTRFTVPLRLRPQSPQLPPARASERPSRPRSWWGVHWRLALAPESLQRFPESAPV